MSVELSFPTLAEFSGAKLYKPVKNWKMEQKAVEKVPPFLLLPSSRCCGDVDPASWYPGTLVPPGTS